MQRRRGGLSNTIVYKLKSNKYDSHFYFSLLPLKMKRKKDYLIKIVFFLLCVTFTTAEDEEVILEKLWHQVSTFQLE